MIKYVQDNGYTMLLDNTGQQGGLSVLWTAAGHDRYLAGCGGCLQRIFGSCGACSAFGTFGDASASDDDDTGETDNAPKQ